jgi:hypothetical protein
MYVTMRDEEWIKKLEDGRGVKFTYRELPEDGAFITAQLAGNLRHPTIRTRRMIQFLMTGRNLKLRFGIERGARR